MILTQTFPPLPPHRQRSRKQRKDKGMEGASGVAVEEHLEEHLVTSMAPPARGASVDSGLGASGVRGGEATEGDWAEEAEVAVDRLVPAGATVDSGLLPAGCQCR